MTIEAAIRTHALTDTTILGLVAARMWPLRFPQGALAPGQPVITYRPISGQRIAAIGMKGTGATYDRWQIDAWTISPPGGIGDYTNAAFLMEALRMRFQGFSGLLGGAGGVAVGSVDIAGIPRAIPDPIPEITHLTMDCFIFHAEAIPV